MEYVTVAEFAERAGVTPQAIYKRLKTDLEPYCKTENGTKLISLEGLELLTPTQTVKQSVNEQFLKAEVERLTAELESKQQVINELNKQISSLNEKILDLMDRQSNQFQQLLAIQQTTLQQVVNAFNSKPSIEPATTVGEPIDNKVNKPSLFYRLFHRK